ncbi:MAG TPA: hypothetical protein VN903_36235, partial [Polyangia bacterium]|nr:hypothetical protein [Polyangia bacterium]
FDFNAVWASGDYVVAVATDGSVLSWSNTALSSDATLAPLVAAWASGNGDVFAVGGTTVQHWDGRRWSATVVTDPSIPTFNLSAVWGSGPRDVFAVGTAGAIFHWDGTAWSPFASPGTADLKGVWVSGPNDFYVVGSVSGTGVIFHWRTDHWIPIMPIGGPPGALEAVWGSGLIDVFAVGAPLVFVEGSYGLGVVAHYDGTPWSLSAIPAPASFTEFGVLHAVWGTGPNNAFAVGDFGALAHFDGSSWSVVESGVKKTLWTVAGNSASDVFVGGDAFLHLRAGLWEPIALPAAASIRGLAVSPARVEIVGSMGAMNLDRRQVTCVGPERNCQDGWDDDCDGLADAADPDCAGKITELCANGIDDDADGSTDCADNDCATFPSCNH